MQRSDIHKYDSFTEAWDHYMFLDVWSIKRSGRIVIVNIWLQRPRAKCRLIISSDSGQWVVCMEAVQVEWRGSPADVTSLERAQWGEREGRLGKASTHHEGPRKCCLRSRRMRVRRNFYAAADRDINLFYFSSRNTKETGKTHAHLRQSLCKIINAVRIPRSLKLRL